MVDIHAPNVVYILMLRNRRFGEASLKHLNTLLKPRYILLSTALLSVSVWAAEDEQPKPNASCQAINSHQAPVRPDLGTELDPGIVHLRAEEVNVSNVPDYRRKLETINDEQIYEFTGNVYLQRDQQVVQAQALRYQKQDGHVTAQGNVTLWDPALVAHSPEIELDNQKNGVARDANYWLIERGGHGYAKQVKQQAGKLITLERASYTTCPEPEPFWQLDGRKTRLDLEKEEGVAKDIKLKIRGIPVFYTPYISFPLNDQRKSGFLPSKFGYNSEHGADISLPYYWNIAPNYDATFTPRIMTRRGVSLNTEFRYLTAQHQGLLQGSYLAQDNAYATDDARYQIKAEHNSLFSPRLYAQMTYNEVSDNDYFSDFGNTLEASSTTHLERRLDVGYNGDGYALLGRVQNYQTLAISPGARPYARLPQFIARTTLPEINNQLHWEASADYTYFDRDTDIVDAPIGHRSHAQFSLSYPWRKPGKFFKPKLSAYYTQYNLDNVATDDDSPSRFLYSLSADSGLIFERPLTLKQRSMTQTLEPRLFYLYVPYKDQNQLPIFDSAAYDFSFSQMFRENRFVGNDRISDENRIAVALTSRLVDNLDGDEYLRVSLGQSYHFQDRRVNISTEAPAQDRNTSDLIAEIAARFAKDISVSQTFQWNTDNRDVVRSSTRLRYHNKAQGQILNLAYRLRKQDANDMEQTDASWYWKINDRWNAIGRWNYSLQHQRNLETFAGVEYNSCCWAMRLLARRYLNNVNSSDYASGVFVQVELKGLGGFGRGVSDFLYESIAGFEDRLNTMY